MNTELKILEIIWDLGGEASFYAVVKRVDAGTDYVRIVCQSLGQHDYIDWAGSDLILRAKGRLEVAKLKKARAEKEEKLKAREEQIEKEVLSVTKALPSYHKMDKKADIDDRDYRQEGNHSKRFTGKKGHTVLGY
ncbi:hypothetical protein KKE99_04990 [Patescibacteria group bacterium]|nr:hypothetical protein [Patescibacteria group bacterium]